MLWIEDGRDAFRGQTLPEPLAWTRRIAYNLAADRLKPGRRWWSSWRPCAARSTSCWPIR
jgi:DNA-directed RNA polymerase specialized sigma24 family protein